MHDADLLHLQRTLRQRFFAGEQALRWRPGRELVAELLLYLDDPAMCWQLATGWLRDTLAADRVDGGYGGYVDGGTARDYVVQAESRRDDPGLPSVLGQAFDAADPGLRAVWTQAGTLAIADVSQARGMSAAMRGTLRTIGTAAKLALPLADGPRPVGLVCADWQRESPRWNAALCIEVGQLVREALGPLLNVAGRLAQADPAAADPLPRGPHWDALTPAEREVARLVATGMSYKEVARALGRSLSTVDHHLRRIRHKLGAGSTARLVGLLNMH